MNCKEILRLASQHVGPVVFLTEGKDWINAGLRDLGPALRLAATEIVTAVADTWYDAPTDLLRVREVRDEDGCRYSCWESDIDRYRFEDADTYIVDYYRAAEDVAAETDAPEGSPVFHDALVLYVCEQKKPGIGWEVKYRAKVAQIADDIPPQSGGRIRRRPYI